MDAPIALDACKAPLLLPQASQPQANQAAPLLQHVPPLAPQPLPALAEQPPSSAGKRRSPRLSSASPLVESTPLKEPRAAGVDSVRSNRKVTFNFTKPAAASAAEEEACPFPTFALPSSSPSAVKENDGGNAAAPAPWSLKKGSASKQASKPFAFEPLPPPPSIQASTIGSLGGASRVVVGGSAKRVRGTASRPSLGPSGAIAKSASRGTGTSGRRMSLVARQSLAGDSLYAKRGKQEEHARRMTIDPRV